jgi:phage terminase small subunit
LLGDPRVQAEIARLRSVLAEREGVTAEKIVAELAAIAFADMGDYICIIKGVPILNLSELPAEATRALACVDVDELGNGTTRTRIRLHDKHAALVSMAKRFGLLQGDGVKVPVNVGNGDELESFTVEELRRLVTATHETASNAPELPSEAADSPVPTEDAPSTSPGATRTGGESDEPTSLLPSDPSSTPGEVRGGYPEILGCLMT